MTDDDKHDDRADVLSMAANWYGCVLAGQPNLLNHNASEKDRHWIMKRLIADAESLVELVYGRDDDPPTVPVPPVVIGDHDGAA